MQLDRRSVLIGGGAAIGIAALGSGAVYFGKQLFGPQVAAGTAGEPEIIRSSGGVLSVDLTAKHTIVKIDGVDVKMMTYNGSLPGPTWVANPGDTIKVNFKNELSESTNLHAHGLHVSPEGNSDNVMIEIKSGESFQYEYVLAEDHPTGMSWYHPHLHGAAAPQLFAGMYGAIYIEQPGANPLNGERVLVISDVDFDDAGNILEPTMMYQMMGREGKNILVNGQLTPNYGVEAGATERWRIFNACSSRFLHLHWANGRAQIAAMDNGSYPVPVDTEEVILAPGNRAELLMTIGDKPISLTFDSVAHPDMMVDPVIGDVLATFTPAGAATPAVYSPVAFVPRDIRGDKVAAKRTFTLAMPTMAQMMSGDGGGMSGMGDMKGMHHGGGMGNMMNGMFTINGESFDPLKVNTTVALDTIEEWTIVNTSGMNHPFHLHVWPMQIVSIGGKPVSDVKWQDVVTVPFNSEVVVRIAFEDFAGKTMYHCHILDHEDAGMMAQIEAV